MKRYRQTYAVVLPKSLHAAIEAHAKRLGVSHRALVEAELAHLEHGQPRATSFRVVPRGGARLVEEGFCASPTGQGRRCRRPALKDNTLCGLHCALLQRLEARLAQHGAKPAPASAVAPVAAPAAAPIAPPSAPVKQRPPALNLRRPAPLPLSIAEGKPASGSQEAAPPRAAAEVVLERVGGVVCW